MLRGIVAADSLALKHQTISTKSCQFKTWHVYCVGWRVPSSLSFIPLRLLIHKDFVHIFSSWLVNFGPMVAKTWERRQVRSAGMSIRTVRFSRHFSTCFEIPIWRWVRTANIGFTFHKNRVAVTYFAFLVRAQAINNAFNSPRRREYQFVSDWSSVYITSTRYG